MTKQEIQDEIVENSHLSKQEWNELAMLRMRRCNNVYKHLEEADHARFKELTEKLRESGSKEFKEYCGYKQQPAGE